MSAADATVRDGLCGASGGPMSRWRVRYRRRGKVDRVVRVAWYGDDDSSGGVVVAWRAVVVVGAVSVSVSVLSLSRAPTRVSVSRWGSASRRRARSPGGFSRGECGWRGCVGLRRGR
jgi:hypothetical protein